MYIFYKYDINIYKEDITRHENENREVNICCIRVVDSRFPYTIIYNKEIAFVQRIG